MQTTNTPEAEASGKEMEHTPLGGGISRSIFFGLIWATVNLVLRIAPIIILIVIIGYLYSTMKRGLDFTKLQISPAFDTVRSDDRSWSILYEKPYDSVFEGTVRYAAHWRDRNMRIMTHDILVTSGDFANRSKVSVLVYHHMFTYSHKGSAPMGAINLLHAVPSSETIYRKLCAIRDGHLVRIMGREILTITAYDPNGNVVSKAEDIGCNTLLVKSVSIRQPPVRWW